MKNNIEKILKDYDNIPNELYGMMDKIFENKRKAVNWFYKPNEGLNYKSPDEFIKQNKNKKQGINDIKDYLEGFLQNTAV